MFCLFVGSPNLFQVKSQQICDLSPSHGSPHFCRIVVRKVTLLMTKTRQNSAQYPHNDVSALTFILSPSVSFFSNLSTCSGWVNSPAHISHLMFTVRSCGGVAQSVQKHQLNSVQLVVGVWNTADTALSILTPLYLLSFSLCLSSSSVFSCWSGISAATTNTLLPWLRFSKSQENTTSASLLRRRTSLNPRAATVA